MKILVFFLIICGFSHAQNNRPSKEEYNSWITSAEAYFQLRQIDQGMNQLTWMMTKAPNESYARKRYMELVLPMRTDTVFANENSLYLWQLFARNRYKTFSHSYPVMKSRPYFYSLHYQDSLFLARDSSAFDGVIVVNALDTSGYRGISTTQYRNGVLENQEYEAYQYALISTVYDSLENRSVNTYGEPHWKSQEVFENHSGSKISVDRHFYENSQLRSVDSSYTIDSVRFTLSIGFLEN